MSFTDIHPLALFLAGALSFVVGMAWYSPYLFGKFWVQASGYSEKDKKQMKRGNMALIFSATFCLLLVMGAGLVVCCLPENGCTWKKGLLYGLYVGGLFVAPSMAISRLYSQNRSIILWLIDAGYQMVCMCIMGAILAAWC